MEFRIAKSEFLRGLRLAQGIADRKSTMPMLANVLLRTTGKNQILVAATDLNVSLTAELKAQVAHEGGLTLGAKNLFDLIANAPGDDITLTVRMPLSSSRFLFSCAFSSFAPRIFSPTVITLMAIYSTSILSM